MPSDRYCGVRRCMRFGTRQILTTVQQGIQFELMSSIQFTPTEAGERCRTAPRKFLRDEITRVPAPTCEGVHQASPSTADRSPQIQVARAYHRADVDLGYGVPSSGWRHDAQVQTSAAHCRATRRAGGDTSAAANGYPRPASCRTGARARPTRGEAMVRKDDQGTPRTSPMKAVRFVP
jgi:hypothetical protein